MITNLSNLKSLVRMVVGLLFIQHGLEKIWGFAGGRIDRDFSKLHGIAGPIEVIGGLLLIFGLFTRPTAFILCGEMAVAYFNSWAPRGLWPIANGGEGAVVYCYTFLWLVTAGAGALSLDAVIRRDPMSKPFAAWEGYARSITRIILSFTFMLHGCRLMFGVLAAKAGRKGAAIMALDSFPSWVGGLEILAAALLMLGLFTRPVAALLCAEAVIAYLYSAFPRSPYPMRNGGEEVILYIVMFLYFAVAGAGSWSIDSLLSRKTSRIATDAPVTA
jgi:putative oxidoreductase